MLLQKHRRLRRDHARFATKGLRPQLSRSDPSSRLLQIVEESKEVDICVGLVDVAHVKAARNNFKRLAAAGEDAAAVCKAQAAQHAGILKARPVAQHLNLVAQSQCGTQAERRLPQKLTLRQHELARARVGVACW